MRFAALVTVGSLLGVCMAGVQPAAAQVTPGPARVISTPGASSTTPMITFHPGTGQYGIAYREPFPRRWVGGFLDQDGNRVTGPIGLLNDNGNTPVLRDITAFPFSTAVLSTYTAYGYDIFGNNVFIGDAAGVAFVNNGVTSGLVNYTNNGGDKFVANNCGEHEEMGVAATDPVSQKFFTSYNQLSHFYNNGSCVTSGNMLMAGYHQNGLPFSFSNGPFAIEGNAGSQDAVFNPGTGQIWFGYAPATGGRLSVALMTPGGPQGIFNITGADGISRGNLKLAVHPVTNHVLAIWMEFVNFNPTVKARLFNQNGAPLTSEIVLSDPATLRVNRSWVAATADNFLVVGYVGSPSPSHVYGRVLTPAGDIASPWTQLDFLPNGLGVNNGVDLVANPTRGTYGLVVDTFSDIYFIEVTASAGMALTVTVDGTGAGAVTSDPPGINCPGTCSMSVPPGTDVELFATPANFSDFTSWGGACSGAAACVVTMDAPKAVNATFTRQRFAIAVTATGNGTVTSAPAGIDCGATCAADFDGGSLVQLSATPAAGWRFDGWSGGCSGTGACDIQVTGPESVTATFVQQFTLNLSSSGNGGGQITGDVAGVSCSNSPCAITLDAGTVVQLTGTADAISRFAGWSGACAGSGACTVTMNADRGVDAAFVQQFDITADTFGSGSVQSNPAGISCPGDCTGRFDTNAPIEFTATPAPGWRLYGWSDPACAGPTCTISSPGFAQVTITALFVEQVQLGVSLAGNGTGSVNGNGISCPGDCTETYDAGTAIELIASPDASSVFSGWSGACSGTLACVVNMTAAQSVTATFTLRQYSLDVAVAGAGGGSVTGSGIACPGDCSEIFNHGAGVALVASPDATSIFAGWGGACSGMGACNVSMTSAQAVTATFMPRPTYTLTVSLAGAGSGSVSSNPAGISCGPTCAADFDSGSTVTLTATPGATSTFAGWSGACAGSGACVVTMSAARSVTATFDAVTIASVSGEVAALAPAIGAGPAGSVNGKLANAQASLSRGNRNAAANQLNAAINEIRALVRSGRLSAAAGAELIADLQAILAGI